MAKRKKSITVNGGTEDRVKLLLGEERLTDLVTKTKLSAYVIGKIIFDGVWEKKIDKFLFNGWLQKGDIVDIAKWLLKNYCSLSEVIYWPNIEKEHKD